MSEVRFEIKGIGELNSKLIRAQRHLAAFEPVMDKAGKIVQKKIRSNLSGPILNIQTKDLWSSISYETTMTNSGWAVQVGALLDLPGSEGTAPPLRYASLHEWGGKFQTAKHFVSTSIDQVNDRLINLFNNYVKKSFR